MNPIDTTSLQSIDALFDALKVRFSTEMQCRDDTIAMLQQSIQTQQRRAETARQMAREQQERAEEAEARNEEAQRRIWAMEKEMKELKAQNAELKLRLEGTAPPQVTNINFMSGSQGNVTEIHDNQNVSA